jgi:hypothetical protein
MPVVRIIQETGGTHSGGGGGSANLTIENLTAQVTGTNINFATSDQFVEDSIQVYYNGILQIQNDDYTEDQDLQGITFALAPETGSKVVVIYSVST